MIPPTLGLRYIRYSVIDSALIFTICPNEVHRRNGELLKLVFLRWVNVELNSWVVR